MGIQLGTSTQFVETTAEGDRFHFVCEGCESEGELTIPPDLPSFNCPEGCGAVYVPWKNPEPALMCVVKPVFLDEDDEDDDVDDCAYCGEWERCTCYDD